MRALFKSQKQLCSRLSKPKTTTNLKSFVPGSQSIQTQNFLKESQISNTPSNIYFNGRYKKQRKNDRGSSDIRTFKGLRNSANNYKKKENKNQEGTNYFKSDFFQSKRMMKGLKSRAKQMVTSQGVQGFMKMTKLGPMKFRRIYSKKGI